MKNAEEAISKKTFLIHATSPFCISCHWRTYLRWHLLLNHRGKHYFHFWCMCKTIILGGRIEDEYSTDMRWFVKQMLLQYSTSSEWVMGLIDIPIHHTFYFLLTFPMMTAIASTKRTIPEEVLSDLYKCSFTHQWQWQGCRGQWLCPTCRRGPRSCNLCRRFQRRETNSRPPGSEASPW